MSIKKLARINKHNRDENITFKEDNHEYTIKKVKNEDGEHCDLLEKPISVTTLIHKYFPQFNADSTIDKMMKSNNWSNSKYFGKTKDEIKNQWNNSGKEASSLGTAMHADIENFLNDDKVLNPNTIEYTYFLNFWKDLNNKYPTLRPYRTEWLVYYDNVNHFNLNSQPLLNLAGSIDCVLTDNNDNLVIVDWKRSKEIKFSNRYEKAYHPFSTYDNCNYSHYSLQLNFYRHILEHKYDKKVVFMMLVILHPDNSNYLCIPIKNIDLSPIWTQLTPPVSNH